MSKIAEKKALEAYPITNDMTDFQRQYERYAYLKGYDQATQDFMKKAEGYLNYTLYDRVEIEVFGTLIPSIVGKKEFIDNFKNYMQDEIQN